MAPIGKLIGMSTNPRFRRALATAKLAGLEVETDPSFSMEGGKWKTPEFMAKHPMGYLPAFEGADGFNLSESGAIADYFVSLAPNANLSGTTEEEKAEVRMWQYFADQEITIQNSIPNRMLMGRIPYAKPVFDAQIKEIMGRLEVLDKILLRQTYIVGERITVADIFLATALVFAFCTLIDAPLREKIPNVVRYTNTIINTPAIASVFEPSNYVEKTPTYQAPAKPKKEKEPKAEKAAEAPKPKAEKKKAAKEEEDDDLDLAPPEPPKAKNPLDDLPKSSFNLEEWKRQYSNLDTRGAGGSLEWFYKNFDHDGFSIWRCQFKYNEELTLTFMSNNQIGGFFNRLEASRKYLFGSVGVLGESNNSIIDGALILRGKDVVPVVDVAPDWESYQFTKLDISKPEDKEVFEGAMAWDLVVDGKTWVDGKNFK